MAKPPAAFLAMPTHGLTRGQPSPLPGVTRGHSGTILPQVPSGHGATMPPALTRGRSGASSLGHSARSLGGSSLGHSTRSHVALVEPPRTAGPELVRDTSHASSAHTRGAPPHAPEVLSVSHAKGAHDEEVMRAMSAALTAFALCPPLCLPVL